MTHGNISPPKKKDHVRAKKIIITIKIKIRDANKACRKTNERKEDIATTGRNSLFVEHFSEIRFVNIIIFWFLTSRKSPNHIKHEIKSLSIILKRQRRKIILFLPRSTKEKRNKETEINFHSSFVDRVKKIPTLNNFGCTYVLFLCRKRFVGRPPHRDRFSKSQKRVKKEEYVLIEQYMRPKHVHRSTEKQLEWPIDRTQVYLCIGRSRQTQIRSDKGTRVRIRLPHTSHRKCSPIYSSVSSSVSSFASERLQTECKRRHRWRRRRRDPKNKRRKGTLSSTIHHPYGRERWNGR